MNKITLPPETIDIDPRRIVIEWTSGTIILTRSWHVWPVAAVQGVGFTEAQARAVADLLNGLEIKPPDCVP